MNVRRRLLTLVSIGAVLAFNVILPARADAQSSSAGNPTILEKVQEIQTQIAALESALTALQVAVNSLGSGTSLKDLADEVTKVENGLNVIPPSWGQKLAAGDRFELVLDNAAVLDHETGLVWEKSPSATTQQFDRTAFFLCNDKNVGGRRGWRVPTVWEMLTLIDPTQSNPALPAGHPFTGLQMGNYWTATPFSVGFLAETAYAVGVHDGLAGTTGTAVFFPVWCVRAPGGVNPVNPKSP
jgi:hypothetical protein